ncbi:MAG TPA: TIGR00300 family protein [Ktedonobacterales bacterium]|jgi:lysine-ketoglutarate reductase/saccharopine dehydrogenase-like protein (TIGR00300 family)|nr:TIGR00300 family protein [Ktedonobacterales bacterium]
MVSAEIELRGHIIDSFILPRVWGAIEEAGAHFHVREMRIGQSETEPSYARIEVSAESQQMLDDLIPELQRLGAELADVQNVRTALVTQPGVLPDDFYSTTNLPTEVRVQGEWLPVANIEMDVAIVIDHSAKLAYTTPMHEVRIGDAVVVGYEGVRVEAQERPRQREAFGFMQSPVSSERAKALAIRDVASAMVAARQHGGKILWVLGPAIVHTAARGSVAELIRRGYVQVIFGGNAIVAHDVEAAMFGTSLGVDLKTGEPVEHGHRNHLRAINKVRSLGSLEAAHAAGLLGDGIVAASLEHGVELVLAGSIRDDGPMPGVITDSVVAQGQMREATRGVEVAIMAASMLHAIATGNLLPASVRTVVVDINPAVVTKLADRGSAQVMGLVTDVELFLSALVDALPTT